MQLCFFLIDDVDAGEFYDEVDFPGFAYRGMNVLTTSDVPSQTRACNMPTLDLLLGTAFRRVIGKNLPVELV
jgi:hypothetical protein